MYNTINNNKSDVYVNNDATNKCTTNKYTTKRYAALRV